MSSLEKINPLWINIRESKNPLELTPEVRSARWEELSYFTTIWQIVSTLFETWYAEKYFTPNIDVIITLLKVKSKEECLSQDKLEEYIKTVKKIFYKNKTQITLLIIKEQLLKIKDKKSYEFWKKLDGYEAEIFVKNIIHVISKKLNKILEKDYQNNIQHLESNLTICLNKVVENIFSWDNEETEQYLKSERIRIDWITTEEWKWEKEYEYDILEEKEDVFEENWFLVSLQKLKELIEEEYEKFTNKEIDKETKLIIKKNIDDIKYMSMEDYSQTDYEEIFLTKHILENLEENLSSAIEEDKKEKIYPYLTEEEYKLKKVFLPHLYDSEILHIIWDNLK